MCQHTKPDTLPLAATTGTRRFTVSSGTLPSQAKKWSAIAAPPRTDLFDPPAVVNGVAN
jgi:hypothetical protein